MTDDEKVILGKKALILYQEVVQLRKDLETLFEKGETIGLTGRMIGSHWARLLNRSKNVLTVDTELSESISSLPTPQRDAKAVYALSGSLITALRAFVDWYLPKEEKQQMGFVLPEEEDT